MSCPLLEKLAPETRNLIYEYVLTFETELKHVQKMQPFIDKLCRRTASDSDLLPTSAESSEVNDPVHRVDTSILTASKLIYNEAIVIFYENNDIRFESGNCKHDDIVSPLATDLSLATRVVMRIGLGCEPVSYDKHFVDVSNAHEITTRSLPAIFPSLRTCRVYAYTDGTSHPAKILFARAKSMRASPRYEAIHFDTVGSLVATFKEVPQGKIFVQSKAAMDRWAQAIQPEPILSVPRVPISQTLARLGELKPTARMIQHMSQALPQARVLEDMLIARYKRMVLPDAYPPIARDSHEYWTLVDAIVCKLNQRPE
jgi:hypothetical protein